MLITRSASPELTATAWAQGGIIFRGEEETDSGLLVKDILGAGAGACYPPAVELVAAEGPRLVEEILVDRLRVPFARDGNGALSRTGEGAHSVRRVIHHGDQTGQEIERALLAHLAAEPRVTLLAGHTAVDLLTLAHHSTRRQDAYEKPRCVGAYVLDQSTGEVRTILAQETVLATGGLGQLYLHTTNPEGARGDGVAMAFRTGARIMNLEYVQFHPTALYRKSPKRFLISEAVRGEGGKLLTPSGEEFMGRYDERGALAPRDIVCRALHEEMLKHASPCMYLDISHRPADWIRKRFPAIHEECSRQGVDMTAEPVPVVPAAHYSCGGVAVDRDGNTTIENLKAVGEVSCTGVHGANRLASTSLLEGLVWGVRAATDIARRLGAGRRAFPEVLPWRPERDPVDRDLLAQDWMTIRHTMWNYVGLVRTPKRLDRAMHILRELSDEVEKFYAGSELSDELVGLRNGSAVAQLVLTAALRNRNSRGCHFVRED
jgi:L-aspartate oxidase